MKNINMNYCKNGGFSLAEVLITLGVIGIVAALALPTIIIHINTTKFRTQYKRTLSNLNLAVKTATANYDLNFASVTEPCAGQTDNPKDRTSICALINGTVASSTYYPESKIVTLGTRGVYSPTGTGIPSGTKGYYLFADGSLLGFRTDISKCTLAVGADITELDEKCYGFIDVNATTSPNKVVECSDKSLTKITKEVGDCQVRNNSVDMGDIFPVAFHDGVVEPLTNASRFALNQSILNTKN